MLSAAEAKALTQKGLISNTITSLERKIKETSKNGSFSTIWYVKGLGSLQKELLKTELKNNRYTISDRGDCFHISWE